MPDTTRAAGADPEGPDAALAEAAAAIADSPKGVRLLALVDGSHYSASVCDHAAWIARRADASVHVVHLISRRSLGGAEPDLSGSIGLGARTALLNELAELDARTAKLAQRRGRAILADAGDRLDGLGVAHVTTSLRHGEVVETLATLEKGADLVVVGKRGEAAGVDSGHLGSNLERAIRSTSKPALVASRAFREPRRFLIAFDGGRSALEAVDFVASRPRYNDLGCHLVSAGHADRTRLRQLEGAAATLREAGFEVAAEHVDGPPESTIPAEAEKREADLVVMGAYGHSRIRNLIIGSTTTAVVTACRLPILLFR